LGQGAGRQIDVTVAGHRLHMTLYAKKAPPPINAMTVVFESGLGGGENNWRSVIEQLPTGVSAITYERPGMNGSEPDGLPPSPEHIATVLHTALAPNSSPGVSNGFCTYPRQSSRRERDVESTEPWRRSPLDRLSPKVRFAATSVQVADNLILPGRRLRQEELRGTFELLRRG
jgi:pimeloyl-ACP methyl ester carboxylesterase